jgi:TonB family protein
MGGMGAMFRIFAGSILGVAAAAAPVSQPLQAQAPAHAPPSWQMDWGAQYCTLIRPADEATPYIIGIRKIAGTETSGMVIRSVGSARLPDRMTTIALGPQGASYEVRPRVEEHGRRRDLVIPDLPEAFWAELARAGELQFRRDDDHVLVRAPLVRSADAVTAHRECVADAARAWGIDEAAQRAATRWPRSTNHYGLSDTDYPPQLIDDGVQGRTVVRLTVSADGRATECATVASSGAPALDERTCQSILGRARFAPALGADGRPVALRYVVPVLWLTE